MSKLILVPTPIGNLEDITLRAIKVLKEVDLILAEDTRQTAKLLQHFDIPTPYKSYHQHNEHKVTAGLVELMESGKTLALVSDAGTPGISDPGFYLTRACLEAGIEVEALPGPTALIPALVVSGLPCDRFVFEGFLPHKKGRQTKLKELATEIRTIVLYESPHRIEKTLEQMMEHFGKDRQACLCRELSKVYEEIIRGDLQSILDRCKEKKLKGEIVIVVAGKK